MARSQAYENIYSIIKFSEDSFNAGTGVVTTVNKYISGSIDCFIDGTLTHPTRITELTLTTYSISPAPKASSKIITKYNPLN